jgi:hypothetical protein
MTRDDRIVRNIVIAMAVVEALAIAVFVMVRLHLFG